ncbi:MAG TPA: histidine--tRNA ligase, partial [Candidatus Tenderia electrophaga]|nr:histidine--tRNA ligase [Candidatus Tenderia electrophaga]
PLALILGEDEVANEVVAVKDLRQGEEQKNVDWNELGAFLQTRLDLN